MNYQDEINYFGENFSNSEKNDINYNNPNDNYKTNNTINFISKQKF